MDSENILSMYCAIAEETTLQNTIKHCSLCEETAICSAPDLQMLDSIKYKYGTRPYAPVSFRRLAMPICGVAMGIIQEKCPEEPETIAFQNAGP